MVDERHDKIVRRRVRRIAEEHGISADEVDRALDRHPVNTEPGPYLRRTLALELVELDELEQIFHDKAITESDPVSGALCVKIHERRATLLGLNPPQGHAVQIISQPARAEKSTAAWERALAHLAASRPGPNAESDSAGGDDPDGATN